MKLYEESVKPKISPLVFVAFTAMAIIITGQMFKIRELNMINSYYESERDEVLQMKEQLQIRLDSLNQQDEKTAHLRQNIAIYEDYMRENAILVNMPPFDAKTNLGGSE